MKRRVLITAVLLMSIAAAAAAARRPSPKNPLEAAAAERRSVDAEVLERVPAGSYLYLRVAAGGVERWAVTLAATAASTSRVHLEVFASARDFHSARLHRDFDELWFAAVLPAVQPAAKGATP